MRFCAWEYVVDAINLWFETNQSAIRMATAAAAAAVKWTQWQQRPCAYNLCGTHHHRTGTPIVVSCETGRKKRTWFASVAMKGLRHDLFLVVFFSCAVLHNAHTIDSRSTKNNVLSATYTHRMVIRKKYGLAIRETMTNAHKSKSLHQTNKFARGREREREQERQSTVTWILPLGLWIWMLRRSRGWNKICM